VGDLRRHPVVRIDAGQIHDHLASKVIEPGRGPPGEAAAVPF
jgi:hypothetical protein